MNLLKTSLIAALVIATTAIVPVSNASAAGLYHKPVNGKHTFTRAVPVTTTSMVREVLIRATIIKSARRRLCKRAKAMLSRPAFLVSRPALSSATP